MFKLVQSTKPKLDLSEEGEDFWFDTGASHTEIDAVTFTHDLNQNGKADVFEFIEGTLEKQ